MLIFGIVGQRGCRTRRTGHGRVEDRIGPKKVIMISLIGLITTSIILLFAHGTTMFWIFGLMLDPLGRSGAGQLPGIPGPIAPVGREGEMFGLYATTGRAASFLAPGLFALFSGLFSDRIGIVGIAVVLLVGRIVADRGQVAPKTTGPGLRIPGIAERDGMAEHFARPRVEPFGDVGNVRILDGGCTHG